ncbi:MAG: peptidylprolyl isomerase [Elusimicrobia bacterium]|nr:peptidylprolyl isomerase [Elusimicrobiota bacterium]
MKNKFGSWKSEVGSGFMVLLLTTYYSLLTVSIGCSKKSGKILAQVGSEKITVEEFEKTVENAPYTLQEYLSTEIGRKQYLDAMLKEKTILVAAKSQGIQKRPAVKKQLLEIEKRLKDNYEKLKNEIIMNELLKEKVVLGDSEVKDYYEKHKEEFEKPTEIKVSHILLPTDEDAKKIMERLKKGEDFAKLAKENSTDKTTAVKGGDLGFFGRRQYVKEFEEAAFNLKKIGDISDIIKTPLGYHIIKLTDRKQLKPQKLDDVETEIKQVLQKEKLDKWLNEISKKYKANVNYELLTKPVEKTEQEKK